MPKLDPGRESEYKMTIQVLSTIYIYNAECVKLYDIYSLTMISYPLDVCEEVFNDWSR